MYQSKSFKEIYSNSVIASLLRDIVDTLAKVKEDTSVVSITIETNDDGDSIATIKTNSRQRNITL